MNPGSPEQARSPDPEAPALTCEDPGRADVAWSNPAESSHAPVQPDRLHRARRIRLRVLQPSADRLHVKRAPDARADSRSDDQLMDHGAAGLKRELGLAADECYEAIRASMLAS